MSRLGAKGTLLLVGLLAFAAAPVGAAHGAPLTAADAYADVAAAQAADLAAAPNAQAAPADVSADEPPGQSANAPGQQEDKPGNGPPEDKGNGDQGADKGPAGAGAGGSDGDPPGCNGTIHLSSSASSVQGTDPKYTRGETVYVHGTGFDPAEAFTRYTVEDVNDHAMVGGGGGWSADGGGSFVLTAIATGGLVDAHEYKVTVYWPERLPNGDTKECRKSKNFFLVGSSAAGGQSGSQPGEQPGGQPGTEQPGGGGAAPGKTGPGGTTEQPATGPKQAGGSASAGKKPPRRAGGVAGVTKTIGVRGQLPFTGFPAWLLAVAGAALTAAGFGLRRATATR